MNRRIAKKVLRAHKHPARGRAFNVWHADAKDIERRTGHWSPGSPEWRRRARGADTPGKVRLWWLSFVKDGKFAGACQVWATSYINAVKTAHLMGCNPGGDVQGMAAADNLARLVPQTYIGVLMDKERVQIFEGVMEGLIAEAGLKSVGGP